DEHADHVPAVDRHGRDRAGRVHSLTTSPSAVLLRVSLPRGRVVSGDPARSVLLAVGPGAPWTAPGECPCGGARGDGRQGMGRGSGHLDHLRWIIDAGFGAGWLPADPRLVRHR